jgi:hypothetical protein
MFISEDYTALSHGHSFVDAKVNRDLTRSMQPKAIDMKLLDLE